MYVFRINVQGLFADTDYEKKTQSKVHIRHVFIRMVYYIVPYAYFVVPANNKGYKFQLTSKIIY